MPKYDNLVELLHSKCGVCHRCINIIIDSDDVNTDSQKEESSQCSVCFGISSHEFQTANILPEIRRSLIPYCTFHQDAKGEVIDPDAPLISSKHGNYLSKESPTIQIPLLIQVRAHCAIAVAKCYLRSIGDANTQIRSADDVYLAIKDRVRSSLRELCNSLISPDLNTAQDLPQQLHEEEAGYLSIHTIVKPPQMADLPNSTTIDEQVTLLVPPALKSYVIKHRQKIMTANYKVLNPRTRFRGNDPTLKQGGDPRKNLELRLRRETFGDANVADRASGQNKRRRLDLAQNKEFNESDWNAIISWLDKDIVNQWCNNEDCSIDLAEWFEKQPKFYLPSTNSSSENTLCCSVNATTWRRPFCIHGYYTKTRRDVSQTPFYVSGAATEIEEADNQTDTAQDNQATDSTQSKSSKFVRKGISSVEEEICPILATVGCKGISELNNDPESSVVYGLCKFHASGREDMDVRMILPHPSVQNNANLKSTITGRSFVCEVIDSYGIPTLKDMECIQKEINDNDDKRTEKDVIDNGIGWDNRGWPYSLVPATRSYGNNTSGVGVSSLGFVSSKAFSNLQSETENKVKHYGCICWSDKPIESNEFLSQKLGISPGNDTSKATSNTPTFYPLKINQNTPIRVLHRRSSDIRCRYILTLSACRIDLHWFQLRLSTSAGTYVKEFVHGDCGRTYPSISSMLGGRVDITELDCEGIAEDSI